MSVCIIMCLDVKKHNKKMLINQMIIAKLIKNIYINQFYMMNSYIKEQKMDTSQTYVHTHNTYMYVCEYMYTWK